MSAQYTPARIVAKLIPVLLALSNYSLGERSLWFWYPLDYFIDYSGDQLVELLSLSGH